MEIRDRREAHWFWIHDIIVDIYGPQIGAYGIAVYAALARYADREGHATPSLTTLARTLHISRNTILKTLETLTVHHLLAKSQRVARAGHHEENIYTLLSLPLSTTLEKMDELSLRSTPDVPPSINTTSASGELRSAPREPPSASGELRSAPRELFLENSSREDLLEKEENSFTTFRSLGGDERHEPFIPPIPSDSTPMLPLMKMPEPHYPRTTRRPSLNPLPQDDWLRALLLDYTLLDFDALNDADWWIDISQALAGVFGQPWLNAEFGKLSAYLRENPRKRPASPGGWKRFVRGWLHRNYEYQRRQTHASTHRQ